MAACDICKVVEFCSSTMAKCEDCKGTVHRFPAGIEVMAACNYDSSHDYFKSMGGD